MQIDYPLRLDGHGLTALTTGDDHIRDMIEQVLFTSPGERVNRPDFGCGLMRLIFSPNSEELAAATQYMVQGSLQQWLGHLILVEKVDVDAQDSALYINVQYLVLRNQERRTEQFSREV